MFCKLISLLAVSLLLTGCDNYYDKYKPLTNEQILKETGICRRAGLFYHYSSNSHYETVKVTCD